jgi:hypothetical protein
MRICAALVVALAGFMATLVLLTTHAPAEEAPPTGNVSVEGVVLLDDVPIAHATVRADWVDVFPGGRQLTPKSGAATTDGQGKFRLDGVSARFPVALRAELDDAFSAGSITVKGAELKNVRIPISRKNGARLKGQITNSAGAPLAHVAVVVQSRPGWQSGPNFSGEAADFSRDGKLQTGPDGRYQTPPVPKDRSYRLVVALAGHEPAKSDWLIADDATHPLVVNRLIDLGGTLHDRAGRPIVGAGVACVTKFRRARTTSDEAGRFELKSVPEIECVLFIGHEGFRFFGEAIARPASPIDCVLVRTSESSMSVMKTRPLVPREERLQLARRILGPLTDRLINPERNAENEAAQRKLPFRRSRQQQLLQLAQALAKVEPQTVLDYLNSQPTAIPITIEDADSIRVLVSKELRFGSVDRTRDLISQTATARCACTMLCDLFDAIDPKDRAGRLELLAEALVKARETHEPAWRVLGLASVGKRLFDLGERERATAVLREGEEAARRLPPIGFAGYARGMLAAQLAAIDVDAALALTANMDSLEFVRHHGNMAHRLAGLNPQQAERVLNLITRKNETSGFDRDRYAIRVCYRLASRDLPRGRRIADTIRSPIKRAQAFGVMADALAKSQPASATELLQHAFVVLDQAAAEAGPAMAQPFSSPGPTAGSLLATAESIDPSLVPEHYWHALSFQLPPTEEPADLIRVSYANGGLAGFLARYDTSTAQKLLDAINERPAARALSSVAQVLIDPVKAIERVEAMPEGRELDRKDLMRLEVAEQLATRDARYWQQPARNAGLWIIDDEDLGE